MIATIRKRIIVGFLSLVGFIGLTPLITMAVPCTCGLENGYDNRHNLPNMRICVTEMSDSWTEFGCSQRCDRAALMSEIVDPMRQRYGDRTQSPKYFNSGSHISDCESWCNEKQGQGIKCLQRVTTDNL